ncbi:sodium:solute symporter [Puniceicoccus vermicola]|uniref:Sodium/solute symporter n=1 Tax=Puniceicoccus vermicola TaxID=388746 RepID=A0A7X1E6C5_9BACT|nr:sodium:solute symporter [Puniceicoccus vermicola]MBC2604099.1 sodium/solute symporter [Puniceicoccus vermicola]
MEPLDWLMIAGYFALLLGVAWWVIRKKNETADDYFLAGRNLGWFIIGASIFASNIGSEHLVGLAGSGATDGVAMAHYELHAWCLLILGWIMAPFYMRSKVFTMPEFLERRFSPHARTILSLISLFAYVLTKIAVGIFAGGIVFATLLPEIHLGPLNSFWLGSILVLLLTGAYTILGGLRAVAYTEALQTFILVFGSALVTFYGLRALGDGSIMAGWGNLREIAGSEMFNLWKPIVRAGAEGTWEPIREISASGEIVKEAWYFNGNYPWLSMLFCAPIIGLWYWCTDQYIVQRMLGAPNEKEARRGTIFASGLKLLPVFLFIIPGMICFALAKSGTVAALSAEMINPDTGEVIRENAQAAFPLLVQHVLPAGFRGIVVAGLLAALMSSLAGVLNATATLFTMDFYSRIKKNVDQKRLIWIGRVATAVLVCIGLLWIPVIQGAKGLYDYLQGVQAYLAPPIFVVFFFGVFVKRLNGPGCLATLVVGFALGLFRLAVDTPAALMGHVYEEGTFLWIVNNIFFQYYSIIILIVCIITFYVVSYATKAPDYEKISGLTFGTVTDDHRKDSRSSRTFADYFWSGLVIVFILAAYLYFRG